VDPAALTDYCVCLVFLTENAVGRIERYESCPQHWRLSQDQFEIPRGSAPVDLDDFLDLVDA
jgi:hypothetical protein